MKLRRYLNNVEVYFIIPSPTFEKKYFCRDYTYANIILNCSHICLNKS